MNYTYLPSSPHSPNPVIVMTTNLSSRKTANICANPNVSLLVHDCMSPPMRDVFGARTNPLTLYRIPPGSSHRPPTHGRRLSGGSPVPEQHRSSLAALLQNLNSSEVSSISATIGGAASLAPAGSEEERYFCDQHLANNTFEEGSPLFRSESSTGEDGMTSHFVAGEQVRVIVVEIRHVRISDWKGTVRDLDLLPGGNSVNGVQ